MIPVPLVPLARDYPPLYPPDRAGQRCKLCDLLDALPDLTVRVQYRRGWIFTYRVCQRCYDAALRTTPTTAGAEVLSQMTVREPGED